MILPLDWDHPKEGNKKLCKKFEYRIFSWQGESIPYRIFIADIQQAIPLVVYLHGADAIGTDNESQLTIHDIGTMFARESWQIKHPCHILAPQYQKGKHWSMDNMIKIVYELVHYTIHALHVDSNRVYLYGYSAGGVGTLRQLKAYPKLYAGAISICGATSEQDLEKLKSTPLWLVHAEDDRIVKVSYKEDVLMHYYGSRDLYHELDGNAKDIRYTEYPTGYLKEQYGVNPHCAWVAVSDEKNIKFSKWLFQCRL